MNVLIDTNVVLSAALRDRLPETIVRYVAASENCRWIVTASIVAEYLEVIARPKFGLPPEILRQWAELLAMRTIQVPSPTIAVNFPRDPKDAIFLAAAIAVGADYLITGDNDLLQSRASLALSTHILSVADFATEFKLT
jgi:uncharacterized protein